MIHPIQTHALKGRLLMTSPLETPPKEPPHALPEALAKELPFEAFDDAVADAVPTSFCAALILSLDRDGRALCQLRDDRPGVFAPGFWSCFGGAVDPGETRRAAAKREWAEELGARAPLSAFIPVARLWTPNDHEIAFFEATVAPAPAEIRLQEGAGFGFLTRAQIERFPFIPYIRGVLRAFIRDSSAPAAR